MPEVSQFRWPTPGCWVSGPTRQFFSSEAAPRAAPPRMKVPAPGVRRLGDEVLVVALDGRVGDLEDVEDVHRDVVGEVRQDARHADEADLALALQRLQHLDRAVLLERGPARRHVDLDQVEAVGAEPAQRLLDVGADVRGAVVVRVRRRRVGRDLDQAAALGGEEELIPAVADVGADQLLAAAVVGRGVDQVDAAVEDRVEQPPRVLVGDLRAARLASQLHRPVAEDGHVRAGAP